MYLSGKGGENLNFMPQFFAAKERDTPLMLYVSAQKEGRNSGVPFSGRRERGARRKGRRKKSPVYCMCVSHESEEKFLFYNVFNS